MSRVVQEVFGWAGDGPREAAGPPEQPRPQCVGRAADLSWAIRARVAIRRAGQEQEVFQAADVWRHFDDDSARDDPALGYVLAIAVRNGVIEQVEGGWRARR